MSAGTRGTRCTSSSLARFESPTRVGTRSRRSSAGNISASWRCYAKAGVAAKGEVPAPKPLSKSAVQPDAKRKPIVLAPEENAKIEATNVFALLNMDDDEDGDDAEADVKDGDGEEEAKEEP